MKKFLLILLFLSVFSYGFKGLMIFNSPTEKAAHSQKISLNDGASNFLYNLNFSENFENPVGWNFINETQANQWHIGSAVSTGTGSQSLYISNDNGVTNAYFNSTSSRVFAYKAIAIPAGTSEIEISFDWRCLAESGNWDYMRVWITNESFVPVTTAEITALENQRIQVGGNFNNNGQWSSFSDVVNVSGLASQNAKLIIEWNNDDGWGDNPPAAIDNIDISPVTCGAPQNISTTNFSQTSATLSWEVPATSNAASYEYYLALDDTAPDTSTTPTGTTATTNITLIELVAGTDYYFWVRTICTGQDGTSLWAGPFVFSIPPVNNDCDDAIPVPVNTDATCTNIVNATMNGATLTDNLNISDCNTWGEAAKDVWFEFIATENSHFISILDTFSTWNMYIQLYPDSVCITPGNSIACSTTPMIANNLVPGNTYKIRVFTNYDFNNDSFAVCVRTMNPPDNDDCDDAITVPVNEGDECIESVEGTLSDATISNQGGIGCNWDSPIKDVWYEFTATSENHAVIIEESDFSSYAIHLEVYEDAICDTESEALVCSTSTEVFVTNLTIGNTYKIRVFSTSVTNDQDFSICILTLPPKIISNDTQYTIPELVSDILIDNDCAEISNITWSTGTNYGDVNGIGYFEKNNSIFPFENGILLTTGDVNFASGPANQTTGYGSYMWPGDLQLTEYMNDYLNEPTQHYENATVLEFDFTAVTDSLKFNFIFASNEYGTYQCSFSDAFAFFLTNTETNETTNLAIVPNTTDPISVVTIRKEIHSPEDWWTGEPECGDANPEYFGDFYFPDQANNGLNPILSPINFYGSTIPMVAQSAVDPGTVYHIKLVIQDRGDSSYDSAVFLEGGSFDLGTVDLGDDLLIETGTALCEGESVYLDTSLSADEYTFEWFKDDELISGQNEPTLEVTESGVYKVEATFIGSICAITNSVIIEIFPPIELVQPGDLGTCLFANQYDEVDLTQHEDVLLSLMEDQELLSVSYFESPDDAENNTNPITNPVNFIPTELPMTVYIRVENTVNGCYKLIDFRILRKVVVDFVTPEPLTTCVYHNVIDPLDLTVVEENLRLQSENEIEIFYFETQNDAENLTNSIENTTDYVPQMLPATIYVSIVDVVTGCQSVISFTIYESESIALIEQADITSCTQYKLPVLPEGYYYSTEEFGQGHILQVGHVYGVGSHTVYVNIKNEQDCVFSTSFNIQIIECNVQKGISPNGDGLNDYFDLTYYFAHEVKIFNRYGKEVYAHGLGYTNQWVGQDKHGNLLPEGTYFYRIVTDFEELTGYIYLSREIR